MTQQSDDQTVAPEDINLFGESDWIGQNDEPADDPDPGTTPDAEAMVVSLKKTTHNDDICVEVYAHNEAQPENGLKKPKQDVLLARVTERELTMFPLVSASYRDTFLTPKYDALTKITILAKDNEPWEYPETVLDFDSMLESLPVGFGRHAKYGLGLKWEYRLIPNAILEMHGITELVIEPGYGAVAEPPKFRLGIERFVSIRKSIDSITARARSRSLRDRQLLTYNELLHVAAPTQFKKRFPNVKPGEIYELVKLSGQAQNRSAGDRLAATTVIRDDAEKIAAEQPAQLLELKSVIEQVTLKELIAKFEDMLSQNLPEPKWQSFFMANPFVLSLAFPYPVILIQDQAHVGGTMLNGSGESIVDFLLAQRFTGNLAIIEIKRPSTHLIEPRTFRGDLHAPHKDMTSAMAQVLDQRFQLLNNFAAKAHDPSLKDTHVSAVHCIVIAGTTPSTIQGKRSLDLFRNSSRDVVVLTFDELLEKIREIFRLMTGKASTYNQPEPPHAPI